jgi:hypothetical protein
VEEFEEGGEAMSSDGNDSDHANESDRTGLQNSCEKSQRRQYVSHLQYIRYQLARRKKSKVSYENCSATNKI